MKTKKIKYTSNVKTKLIKNDLIINKNSFYSSRIN